MSQYSFRGLPIAQSNEDIFQGKAEDGSIWSIPVNLVISDMEKNETSDDKWPRPITREMAKNWLSDNADAIEGWSLQSAPSLTPKGFQIIR
jgi:hypothetical protein